MALGQQQGLEWPGGPERHHGQPVLGLHHDAGAVFELPLHVVDQQRAAVLGQPGALVFLFPGDLVGREVAAPPAGRGGGDWSSP